MQCCECRLTERVGVALSRKGNHVTVKLWVVVHNTPHQSLRSTPYFDVYPNQWSHIIKDTQGSVHILKVVRDSAEVYTFFTYLPPGTTHTTEPLFVDVHNFTTAGFLTLPTHDAGMDKSVLFLNSGVGQVLRLFHVPPPVSKSEYV